MRQNATATTWLQRGLLAVLGTTLVVAGLQASGNSVATVNVADGTVWLATPAQGTLVQVSASSEQVLANVRVTTSPGDSLTTTQDGHSALVLNRSTGEVGRVDGAELAYVDQRLFPGSSADLQLVSGGGRAFLIDTNQGTVHALDATDLHRGSDTPIDAGPRESRVDSKGTLWSLDATRGKVTRISADGSHVSSSTASVGGQGATLTLVDDRPYVVQPGTSDDGGRIIALDTGNAQPRRQYCLDGATGSAPLLATGTSPADRRQLAVAMSGDSGQVLSSDLQSGKCMVVSIADDSAVAGAGGSSGGGSSATYGQPVASGDLLFVPVLSAGAVVVVDTAENRIVRTIESKELFVGDSPDPKDRFKGQRFELLVDDGNVWFNDLDGPEASVLDRDGVALRVLKYDVTPGARGTGDVSKGVAASDDPNGLAVDVDPRNGTVGSTRPGTDQAGNGGAGGSGQGGQGTDTGSGNGSGGLGLTPPVLDPQTGSTLQLLPPGSASDAARNQGAALPDVTVTPPGSRTTGPASSLSPLPSQSAVAPDTPNAPKPPPSGKLTATFHWSTKGDIPLVGQPILFTDASSGSPPANSWLWDFGDGTTDKGQNPSHTYAKPGTYPVTLTVGNGQATDKSVPAQIEVKDPQAAAPPAPNFSYSPTNPEVGQPVTFKDLSLGSPTDFTWAWGDGTATQTGASPSHTFTQAGKFRVTLTVSNRYGSSAMSRDVDVTAKVTVPTAAFTFSPAKPTVKDPVTFTDGSDGGPSSWRWDFGDGSAPLSAKNVSHAYEKAGTYTVRLVASNAKGSSETTRAVTVSDAAAPPTASMTVVPGNTVDVDQQVTFTSTSKGDPTSTAWDFDDGSTSSETSVVHKFSTPGTYKVKLTVRNAVGADTATVTMTVAKNAKLVANFSVQPGANSQDAAPVNTPVQFRDVSGPSVTTRQWDFGDGAKATGASATHTYAKAGQYSAKLTVSDGTQSAEVTRTVFVIGPDTPAPTADFTFTPAKPSVAETVTFTDGSKNAAAWSWDFGDGAAATSQNAAHAYASAGTYNVTLTVKNGAGQTASRTQAVAVVAQPQPAPKADFSWDPAPPFAGKPVTFTDITAGALTTPQFTFPTGTVTPSPGSKTVPYTFATSGTFQVKMKVCLAADPTNCGEVTKDVPVQAAVDAPVAAFTMSGGVDETTAIVGEPVVFTDTSTGEPFTAEDWTIGDKAFSGKQVPYTASVAGDVTVTLTVKNSAGSANVRKVIHFVVRQPATAQFAWAPTTPPAGSPVQFTDQSTGGPTRWSWTFGDDGSTSTAQSPQHTFAAAGTFKVTLVVTNQWGDSTPVVKDVTVQPAAPQPQIHVASPIAVSDAATAVTGAIVARGAATELSDASNSPGVTSWAWDFGDGTTGSGQRVSHTWDRAGTYTVTLTATAPSGRGQTSVVVRVM